jgi:hypothetical protein
MEVKGNRGELALGSVSMCLGLCVCACLCMRVCVCVCVCIRVGLGGEREMEASPMCARCLHNGSWSTGTGKQCGD